MEQRVEATDLDTAHEILSGMYDSMRIEATGGRPGHLRIASASLGGVRFDQVSFTMALEADGSPLETYAFGQLTSGRLRHGWNGSMRSYLPGEVFLAAQPDDPFTATVDDTGVELAVVDRSLVDDVAGSVPERARRPVRFTAGEAVSTRATERWKSTYAYVHNEARTSSAGVTHPLVAGNAARLLVATALATFPNTALTDPTVEDRHDAHPATLRRAIAFMEANADRDVSLADIAGAAHVTVRAVQLAFRRHLDTTPAGYLRRIRLDRAHRQLQAADPDRDSVTAVAYRWGFSSPSRFASYYRRVFGVQPSHTLRS